MTYTLTLTPEKVYGGPSPNIPRGHKAIAFKPPKVGELYVPVYGDCVQPCVSDYGIADPRIIVEKMVSKRYVFEPVGEERRLQHGDYYRDAEGWFRSWSLTGPSVNKYQVFSIREEEYTA